GADFVEVVRRLWDSWEDDAVIHDVPTGRFIDRDKLHYIDFEGQWFSVRGPSITPRPPQGQLPVTALAHAQVPYEFAARAADIVFITPGNADHAAQIIGQVKTAEIDTERARQPLRIYADLTVFLDDDEAAARQRKERLDRADGEKKGAVADGLSGATDEGGSAARAVLAQGSPLEPRAALGRPYRGVRGDTPFVPPGPAERHCHLHGHSRAARGPAARLAGGGPRRLPAAPRRAPA
ncbi:MAG TPA: LLM class flavin-dependent oxidoreductase, partial [Trebonia sp.]